MMHFRRFGLWILMAMLACGLRAQSISLVKDIQPQSVPSILSNYSNLAYLNNQIFAVYDNSLWSISGMPGSSTVELLQADCDGCGDMKAMAGKTFYYAQNQKPGLWATDGTAAGTEQILPMPPYSQGFSSFGYFVVGNQLLILEDLSGQAKLWVSDGTASGTSLVTTLNGYLNPQMDVAVMGGKIYFSLSGKLYASDGTVSGTQLVRDIVPGGNEEVWGITEFQGRVWFFANDQIHGAELWSSDGTTVGTTIWEDILPGTGSGVHYGNTLCVTSTHLYYMADDGGSSTGQEWHYTDGTQQGSGLMDYTPGSASTNAEFIGATSTHVFFYDAIQHFLVSLDVNGATQLIPNSQAFWNAQSAKAVGNMLYFAEGLTQIPYRSDGTLSGTQQMPANFAFSGRFSTDGSELIFAGASGSNAPTNIWRIDATGTLNPTPYTEFGSTAGSSMPGRGKQVGNQVLFVANDGIHGQELWRTDGTTAGTSMVLDAEPGTGSIYFNESFVWNNTLYYGASTTASGGELWKSDGTTSGTSLVADLVSGTGSSYPYGFFDGGSNLFFTAEVGNLGRALYRTDGTPQGTHFVYDFTSEANGGLVDFKARLGNNYLIQVRTSAVQVELWILDGSNYALTRLGAFVGYELDDFYYFGGKLYFIHHIGSAPRELWSTQGTPATTMLEPIANSISGGVSDIWGILNGKLVMKGIDTNHGVELWITDGTVSGTQVLHDINPGAFSSFPENPVFIGNQMLFTAHDQVDGTELWKTDGTSAGTSLVLPLVPGTDGLSVRQTAQIGNLGYFLSTGANSQGAFLVESDGTASGTAQYYLSATDPRLASIIGVSARGILMDGYDSDHGDAVYLYENGAINYVDDPTQNTRDFRVFESIPYNDGFLLFAGSYNYGQEVFFLDSLPQAPVAIAPTQVADVDAGVSAYPVPAHDVLNLRALGDGHHIQGYAVLDMLGHVVAQAKVTPQADYAVDLSEVAAGMYVVRVDLGKAGFGSLRIVKE